MNNLVIGFDIGTSSIKLVCLNKQTNNIEFESNKSSLESRIFNENKNFNEQDVDVILKLVNDMFKDIPNDILKRVKAIQICGQMHGIVLWNTKTKKHSSLVTWQDARCDKEFLENLPVKSISDLNSGYGCATLFWYKLNLGKQFLAQFDSAGTIHDYITYRLTNSNYMSPHNALSWGYFDLDKNNWQEIKYENEFPENLLPKIEHPGYFISNSANILEYKIDASVCVALGDLQCSVYSCLESDTDCVINISTSSQVCFPIEKDKYMNIRSHLPKSITIFPYFDNKILLVSASLNGGNVLDHFIEMIIEWNSQLGLSTQSFDKKHKDLIWERLIQLAEDKYKTDTKIDTSKLLNCKPTLFAERHDKDGFGCFGNIRYDNIHSVADVFDSICKGLIENLNNMFNFELLAKLGCKTIVASGNCILRNPILRKHLQNVFENFPVKYKSNNDSALGAALYVAKKA